MQKAYGIVEPKILHTIFSNPDYHIFATPIMTWICERLRSGLADHAEHVEFEVICVRYFGGYPAIGLHYKNPGYQDLQSVVEPAVERILRDTSALELVAFLGRDKIDWNKVTKELISKRDCISGAGGEAPPQPASEMPTLPTAARRGPFNYL